MMQKITHCFQHLVRPEELKIFPLDWDTLFVREAPLALEIGFGNGEYLSDWATACPDQNLVGIELSMESMERIQKRLHRQNIANVRIIRSDARFAIREFFKNNSLSQVVMNFPDPWPKEKHKRRRLITPEFITILSAVLAERGAYELITDQLWYAEQAHELFQRAREFTVQPLEANPRRAVSTKYERKWREIGRNSYRVIAIKRSSRKIVRLLEDISMPHVYVKKSLSAEHVKRLIGLEYGESDKLFVVKGGFIEIDSEQYLLRIVTKDRDFKQSFYVVIIHREKHHWLVKLDAAIQPYRTPAVKMAVWKIGQLLNEDT